MSEKSFPKGQYTFCSIHFVSAFYQGQVTSDPDHPSAISKNPSKFLIGLCPDLDTFTGRKMSKVSFIQAKVQTLLKHTVSPFLSFNNAGLVEHSQCLTG